MSATDIVMANLEPLIEGINMRLDAGVGYEVYVDRVDNSFRVRWRHPDGEEGTLAGPMPLSQVAHTLGVVRDTLDLT